MVSSLKQLFIIEWIHNVINFVLFKDTNSFSEVGHGYGPRLLLGLLLAYSLAPIVNYHKPSSITIPHQPFSINMYINLEKQKNTYLYQQNTTTHH